MGIGVLLFLVNRGFVPQLQAFLYGWVVEEPPLVQNLGIGHICSLLGKGWLLQGLPISQLWFLGMPKFDTYQPLHPHNHNSQVYLRGSTAQNASQSL